MNNGTGILDLRHPPGQLVETSVEAGPAAERSGVYRYVGAGGAVKRPAKADGPAPCQAVVRRAEGAV